MGALGAILLAAGSSERFGSGNKLLAEIGGQPMVRVVADAVAGAGCIPEVVVVTGHDAPAIEAALHGLKLRFVFNEDWRDGMGGSIARGVASLTPELAGVAIVPGDMPFLTPSLLARLVTRFNEGNEELIIFPTTPSGEQRNPVIWPRQFFSLLQGLRGRQGAKRLLTDLGSSCSAGLIEDERVLRDIDTIVDLSQPGSES
jgi:molybdenum cofactor cytidylyltransferase